MAVCVGLWGWGLTQVLAFALDGLKDDGVLCWGNKAKARRATDVHILNPSWIGEPHSQGVCPETSKIGQIKLAG